MSDHEPSSGGARGHDGPYLVLGYDRSESSRHASCWAAHQLRAGGKLVIVHACRAQHMPPLPLGTRDERNREGRAIIDELILDGDEALLDIDLESEVSDADPASALIDAAARHEADAIVIGGKPHSRLHKALGTVTTELLGCSPVPVIAVPLSAERVAESDSLFTVEAHGERRGARMRA